MLEVLGQLPLAVHLLDHALVLEELVEGAVWFEEEVFGAAGHEDFWDFFAGCNLLFQKIFRRQLLLILLTIRLAKMML